MLKELLAKFSAVIQGTTSDAARDLLENLQKSLQYCVEENAVLREILEQQNPGKQLRLSGDQKRRLARKAINLKKCLLSDVTEIFRPKTILGWHRQLVGKKYDRHGGKKPSPALIQQEYCDMILKMARSNPEWGYARIAAYMAYIDMKISASTVKRVLDDNGMVPDPEKKRHVDWKEFIESHRAVIAATDFLTTEVLENQHLERYHILFFIRLDSRKVQLGGIRQNPHESWMMQIGRNQTDAFDGFLNGKKYLIHDRDPLYTDKFSTLLKASGITTKKIRARTPDMNAYAERFIQSIQKECLNKLILTSEEQLWHVVNEYILYYNHERPHQGLGGKMIEPWPQHADGKVVEFHRIGGLLKSYRRVHIPDDGNFGPIHLSGQAIAA